MTREEQIDWLCRLRSDLNNGVIFTPWNKEFTEALNDVLEQEPIDKNFTKAYNDAIVKAINAHWELIIDEIRAEIDALPSYVARFNGGDFAIHIDKEKVLEIIDKYKAESEGKE